MKNIIRHSRRSSGRRLGNIWGNRKSHGPNIGSSRLLMGEQLEARAMLSADGLVDTPWQNPTDSTDVNNDGIVNSIDLLKVIRELNNGARALDTSVDSSQGEGESRTFVDVNGDNLLTSLDVLLVTRRLNDEAESEGEDVQIALQTTDLDGNSIDSAPVGGQFILRATVQDLRDPADVPLGIGVFSAYFDVSFDTSLASVDVDGDPDNIVDFTAAFTFGENYSNGLRAINDPAGFREAGGASSVAMGLGGDPLTLWEVTLNADTVGQVAFAGSDSGNASFPIVTFDADNPLLPEDVDFGMVTIDITAGASPVAVDDAIMTDEDVAVAIDVLSNDTDADGNETIDPSTVTISSDPANGSLNIDAGTGVVTYTPNQDFSGEDTFSYNVQDTDGNISGEATVTITVNEVNDAPVAANDEASTNEAVEVVIDILSNDSDVDGTLDPASVSITGAPTGGSISIDSGTGAITYTPNAGFTGIDTFSYTVQDNDGAASQEATVTVTVSELNQSVRISLAAVDITTGQQVTNVPLGGQFMLQAFVQDIRTASDVDRGVFAAYLDVLYDNSLVSVDVPGDPANPDDFEAAFTFGDVFTDAHEATNAIDRLDDVGASQGFELVLGTEEFLLWEVVMNADGVGMADFTAAESGSLFNTIVLFDPPSSVDPSEVEFVSTSVSIFTGMPPEAVDDTGFAVDEDVELMVDAASGVLINDISNSGGALTAVLFADAVNGSVILNDDGSFTYTPNENFFGDDSFSYQANDGTLSSNPATVTITVNPQPDDPIATADQYEASEDVTLNVNAENGVLANDIDPDGGSLTATLVANPMDGTLTFNADGSFSYSPNSEFIGTDSFTYVANNGTTDTAETTVTINVNAVNDPPTAIDDQYDVDEDATLSVNANDGVLMNDSDQEGDALTAVLAAGPANGTVSLESDGSFTYTPNADFFGIDSFTYTANDGSLNSAEATVNITINPTPDAPVAVTDDYSAIEGIELVANAAEGVLANDIDVDGDDLTAIIVTDPTDGTLMLNADGSFSYTPDAGFVGVDTFEYKANDGSSDSDPVTVTISVGDITPSTIGGSVYVDSNSNGVMDDGERMLGGITVTLQGTDIFGADVNTTTQTAKDGSYEFGGLLPGSYNVVESQPAFMRNGNDSLGSEEGENFDTLDNTLSFQIEAGSDLSGNNFGESGLESQFFGVRDFLNLTSREAIDVAIDESGNQQWFSFREGWDDFVSAEVSLSDDMMTVTLTVEATDGTMSSVTMPTWGDNKFRILGSRDDGMVVRMRGSSSDFDLQPVAAGEGESNSQASSSSTPADEMSSWAEGVVDTIADSAVGGDDDYADAADSVFDDWH